MADRSNKKIAIDFDFINKYESLFNEFIKEYNEARENELLDKSLMHEDKIKDIQKNGAFQPNLEQIELGLESKDIKTKEFYKENIDNWMAMKEEIKIKNDSLNLILFHTTQKLFQRSQADDVITSLDKSNRLNQKNPEKLYIRNF